MGLQLHCPRAVLRGERVGKVEMFLVATTVSGTTRNSHKTTWWDTSLRCERERARFVIETRSSPNGGLVCVAFAFAFAFVFVFSSSCIIPHHHISEADFPTFI